jgi:hypothetical protein
VLSRTNEYDAHRSITNHRANGKTFGGNFGDKNFYLVQFERKSG